jgi:THAP4-like, heme-binding beta-barrel domain
MEIPSDLAPALVPLAWLLGRWEGAGVVGYPTVESANFGQELEVSHDGRPFLRWDSRTWLLDEQGAKVRPLATESGFWRVAGPAAPEGTAGGAAAGPAAAADGAAAGFAVEFLLAHPTGYVEIYVGAVAGAQIDLQTDLVARTQTAKEYSAATRIYGLVGGDLLWAMDMAAVGHPMTSHASAQLKKVG